MRTAAPALLPLFRSALQVHLLELVLLQPDREWTLDSLTELVGAPQSSVHRELQRFLDAGLISRDARKRPYTYRAATDAPAYQPLRDLLELTTGVPLRMSRELADVPGVLAAAIHGSWAAGKVRPDSDLDVIIVTDGDRRAAQRAVRRVGREVGRDVDVSVLSMKDFEQLLASRNPFLGKILHGSRIDILGSLSELQAKP